MKVEARHVVFKDPFPWPTRRRLRFTRRGNSVQLLETSLIIEGFLQRLSLPVVDRFFRGALSAWTTVTIPYSRIVRHKYDRRLLLRILSTIVLWLPILLPVIMILTGTRDDLVVGLVILGAYFVLGLFLSLYLNLEILAPLNYLWFRQDDGQMAVVGFRIRAKKRQQEFSQTLESYREATKLRVTTVSAGEEVSPVWPIVLLGVALAGGQVVAPLWDLYQQIGFFGMIDRVERPLTILLSAAPLLLMAGLGLVPRSLVLRWATVAAFLIRAALPLLVLFLTPAPVPRMSSQTMPPMQAMPPMRPGPGNPIMPPVMPPMMPPMQPAIKPPPDRTFEDVMGALFHLGLGITLMVVRLGPTQKEKS